MTRLLLSFLLVCLLGTLAGCDLFLDSGSDTKTGSGAGADDVIIIASSSDIDTSTMHVADFGIRDAEIRGDVLEVDVSYSGGCAEHEFTLFSTSPIVETLPPGTQTYLVHDGMGDGCEALVHDTLQFDLSALQSQTDDAVLVFLHTNLDVEHMRIRYDY